MVSPVKFCGPDLKSHIEITYPNIWQREEFPDWSRLIIGAREGEIPLILELCRSFESPFGILWVLLASRLKHKGGRYQSPVPINYNELELFLTKFQDFFEQDGCHHIWVMSGSGEGQFIFDNHNMIFAYGNLDSYESTLTSLGFTPGAVEIPSPHGHNYNEEFDSSEETLMDYWDWIYFPLQPTDDP